MADKYLTKLFKIHHSAKPAEVGRVPVYLKLDSDVVAYFKSRGRGYQARINEVLSGYVDLVRESENKAEARDRVEFEESCSGKEESLPIEERIRLGQIFFERFYAQCFWHLKRDLRVTESLLPQIAAGLRRHGGREGFFEAKKLCR